MLLGGRDRGCSWEVLWYCWLVRSCRMDKRNVTQPVFTRIRSKFMEYF